MSRHSLTFRGRLEAYVCDLLAQTVVEQFPSLSLEAIRPLMTLSPPPQPEWGELALGCFTLAKMLRLPPPSVAAKLAQHLPVTRDLYVEGAKANGPFLNLHLRRGQITKEVLGEVLTQGTRYGERTIGQGKTVVLDYSSPNIAKHLAFHHLRSAVIGQALKNIFRSLGFQVIGINHLGDWGTQFGKLIAAYKHWGPQDDQLGEDPVTVLNELYVRFQKESKSDAQGNLLEEGRLWFRKLEQGDEEARKLWKTFRDVSLATFDRLYQRLGIKFDLVRGESDYVSHMESLYETLEKKGLLRESEGASIVDLSAYSMPPCLLKKADEASLYATRDLCAAIDRFAQLHFDHMLYVVDTGQSLHFKQFFKVLELMGMHWANRLEHIQFGIIKFGGLKTRTREGNIILLEDVLDQAVTLIGQKIQEKNPQLTHQKEVAQQVGIGAIIFADLSGRRVRDVNFVWEEMLNFEGRTGPYVQYSYARAHSILRKAEDRDRQEISKADPTHLALPEEFQLILALAHYPVALETAARDREPSYVADCLLDICERFHRYHALGNAKRELRVLCEERSLRLARLQLTDATQQVLENGLRILGMAAPREM